MNFKGIDDHQEPVDKLKKKYFFSKLKNDYPIDKQKERTKEIFCFKIFNYKNREELIQINLKSDVVLLFVCLRKL